MANKNTSSKKTQTVSKAARKKELQKEIAAHDKAVDVLHKQNIGILELIRAVRDQQTKFNDIILTNEYNIERLRVEKQHIKTRLKKNPKTNIHNKTTIYEAKDIAAINKEIDIKKKQNTGLLKEMKKLYNREKTLEAEYVENQKAMYPHIAAKQKLTDILRKL